MKGCVRIAEANALEAEPGGLESCGQQRREAANTGPGTRHREAEASSGTEGGGGGLRRVLCRGDQERTCFKKEGHLCECCCEEKNRDVRVRCDIDRSSIWVECGENPTRVS